MYSISTAIVYRAVYVGVSDSHLLLLLQLSEQFELLPKCQMSNRRVTLSAPSLIYKYYVSMRRESAFFDRN